MTKYTQCQACGISIGPGFIETMMYTVGEYVICLWCYKKMRNRGKIEIHRNTNNDITYLFPDGKTITEKERISERMESIPVQGDGRASWLKEQRDSEIRRLYREGKSTTELASLFKLGKRTIERVLEDRWKDERV